MEKFELDLDAKPDDKLCQTQNDAADLHTSKSKILLNSHCLKTKICAQVDLVKIVFGLFELERKNYPTFF
jgi:hypothetical protein